MQGKINKTKYFFIVQSSNTTHENTNAFKAVAALSFCS